MKAVLTFFFLLFMLNAEALEIKVKRMSLDSGYHNRYKLTTNLDEKIVLDCQSFVQGLLFGELGETGILLDEWECAEVIQEMKASLRRFKKYCLEVDLERGVLDYHEKCK